MVLTYRDIVGITTSRLMSIMVFLVMLIEVISYLNSWDYFWCLCCRPLLFCVCY